MSNGDFDELDLIYMEAKWKLIAEFMAGSSEITGEQCLALLGVKEI